MFAEQVFLPLRQLPSPTKRGVLYIQLVMVINILGLSFNTKKSVITKDKILVQHSDSLSEDPCPKVW